MLLTLSCDTLRDNALCVAVQCALQCVIDVAFITANPIWSEIFESSFEREFCRSLLQRFIENRPASFCFELPKELSRISLRMQ